MSIELNQREEISAMGDEAKWVFIQANKKTESVRYDKFLKLILF